MKEVQKNYTLLFFVVLFIAINGYLFLNDVYIFSFLPVVLIVLYISIYHTTTAFLITAFLTPLSVNIEEISDIGIGIYLPTEPIMITLLFLIILKELTSSVIDKKLWKHPITLTIGLYLVWVFITSITSTHPLVSFKYLLMKVWYIIPILGFGVLIFKKQKNIVSFLWCYTVGTAIVIIYTLIRHAGYGFGEKEGHWVMTPFFKDHTIYGAAISISFYFAVGLSWYYKNKDFVYRIFIYLLITITGVGIYFSYTRGAWISVACALFVWGFIRYKVKFKYLLTIGVILTSIVLISWHQIEDFLEENEKEHTTTSFSDRLVSSANISTDASNLERINRWNAALLMFQEKPVFGFGPGTYAFEYAPYQDPGNKTIISTNFGNMGNAHSEYLGPLAEMGFVGMLTVIAFVAALFYSGITLLINIKKYTPDDKQLYVLILALVLAMTTYFCHGIINNFLTSDKASIPVYSVAAIFMAQQFIFSKKLKQKKFSSKKVKS